MIKVEDFKIPNNVYSEKFDIYVRPYLTTEDIIEIAELMIECDGELTQEYALILNVLKKCTDIPKEYLTILNNEEIQNEVEDKFLGWDLIIQSGLWKEVSDIVNADIYRVWDYVEDKENANKAIARFVNSNLTDALEKVVKILEKYEKKMPKGKQWNELLTALPNSIREALVTIKEDGNAEIISNAMKMNSVVDKNATD